MTYKIVYSQCTFNMGGYYIDFHHDRLSCEISVRHSTDDQYFAFFYVPSWVRLNLLCMGLPE